VRLFCQPSDFDRELSLADHRADFVNIHDCLLSPKTNGPEAVPRAVCVNFNFVERYIASLTLYFRIPSLEITSR
jgi:hypothetical protein